MHTEIRSARPADASAIARVHVASWRATYTGIVPKPYLDSLDEQEFTERWQKRIEGDPSMSICVAEAEGVLCGFASGGRLRVPVSYYAAELYAIYLLPAAQGNRIGRNLFAAIVDELARQELRHLLVWTLQANPSTAFYERLGGSVVANSTLEIGGKKLPSIAYGWPNFASRSWK